MKLANANLFRASTLADLIQFFTDKGEDVGVVASNTLNFPIVVNGEEGFAEITIKVTKDNGDDGFMKREQYADKVAEAKAKAEAKAEAKAKKIAKDTKAREDKAKAKAEA